MTDRFYYDFDEDDDDILDMPFVIIDAKLGHSRPMGRIGSRESAEKIVSALNLAEKGYVFA
jgi:hypothetical protein